MPNQADEIKLIKVKLNKLLLAIWMVGVEIQINANLAPNWVGVGAWADLGNIGRDNQNYLHLLETCFMLFETKTC